jgi:plasmid stability protein
MAAITIRNISEELVDRIKFLAEQKGISMEQEVRDFLQTRYGKRSDVIERIRLRNETLPLEKESHVQTWIEASRDHRVIE